MSSFFFSSRSITHRSTLFVAEASKTDPTQYILTLEQTVEDDYPIPSYMGDAGVIHLHPQNALSGSAYIHDHDFPPTSDFDTSELSEDVDLELTSDNAPGPSPGISSDSEDEGPQEKDDFGFSSSYEGNRTTFFRKSAERGWWKSNPMPTLLQTRKSAPTHSRVVTPTLINPLRTISEPEPSSSTPTETTQQHPRDCSTPKTTSL